MDSDVRHFWQMVFVASIIQGKSVQGATQNADQAKAAYESRVKEADRDED